MFASTSASNGRMKQLNGTKRSWRRNRLTHYKGRFPILLLTIAVLFSSMQIVSCQRQDANNGDDDKKNNQLQKVRHQQQRKQRRKDAKIVRQIINAAAHGKQYKVLGLRNFEIKVPFKIPRREDPMYIEVFRPTNKDIKQAYRQRARMVHPDKNSHTLAEEAFDALDKATSILLDERLRQDYDLAVREIRESRAQDRLIFIQMIVSVVYNSTVKFTTIGRRVVGPFMTPVVVLGALIV